jgi:hypothetical protein
MKIFDESWTPYTEVLYFYAGADLAGVAVSFILVDIQSIYQGPWMFLYALIQSVYVYKKYPLIFSDYLVLAIIIQVIAYSNNYRRIRTSKISFIQSKKIQQLLDENQKIF